MAELLDNAHSLPAGGLLMAGFMRLIG